MLASDRAMWRPLAGPQSQAYHSQADEIFYGGAAGGGKTDLLLGLALTAHARSIIFRREYPQLKAIVDRSYELVGDQGRFNVQSNTWKLDGRTLEFGAVQYDHDVNKYQGRPHDLKCFDELPNFTEYQYTFLSGWLRTTRRGQRTRIVSAGNPPTSADGEWVIRRWAAWLDRSHPAPARPGDLRWYARVDGKEVEVETGAVFQHKQERIQPLSRTFIPARLTDNPFLAASGYGGRLQALPEPLRSQLLYGDFSVGLDDDPWQCIPTEWVRMAQARWRERERPDAPLTTVAVDVARGGKDKTVLSKRYGTWFAPLIKHPGQTTPDGPAVAGLVLQAIDAGANPSIHVDVIGVGASVYDNLRQLENLRVAAVNFAEGSGAMDLSGRLTFANLRA
ncbi:MAG: terminase, partial [Rhizobiales bacterium]|nr:terminase [Hyphomicrobiales bacterium]